MCTLQQFLVELRLAMNASQLPLGCNALGGGPPCLKNNMQSPLEDPGTIRCEARNARKAVFCFFLGGGV